MSFEAWQFAKAEPGMLQSVMVQRFELKAVEAARQASVTMTRAE